MQKIVLTKGVSSAEELHSEISNYIDVLLGHEKPPIEDGVEALFELSSAYLACLLYTSPSPRDS